MNFEERYSKVSKKLIKADTSKYSEDFAIQITMDDEDCGGTFFAAYIDGAYRVEPYDYVDNTANINLTADVLNKLIDKKITVEGAVYDGVMNVNGNLNHVIMLFNAFEEKPVPKKPAAKKTSKTTVEKKAKKSDDKVKEKAEEKKETAKADKKSFSPKTVKTEKPVKVEIAEKPLKTGSAEKSPKTEKSDKTTPILKK